MRVASPSNDSRKVNLERLTQVLRSFPECDLHLVIDSGIADSVLAETVEGMLQSRIASRFTIDSATTDVLADISCLAQAACASTVVVAAGGGRVLDAAKIAAVAGTQPDLLKRISSTDEALLLVEGARSDRARLVAIPTTLGTGAERSQSAVVDNRLGRVVVVGPMLRPEVRILDPLATRGLSRRMVLGGVFEALMRVVGPAIGSPISGLQDDLALSIAQQLVALGSLCAGIRDPGGELGDPHRQAIAELSASSQGPQLHSGRPTSSFRAWFLTTELSWLAGIDKLSALAAIAPAWWRKCESGQDGWGSPNALDRIWNAIREESIARLAPTPSEGLQQLLKAWEITPQIHRSLDVDELASRTVSRWGHTSLLGLGHDEVALLLRDLTNG